MERSKDYDDIAVALAEARPSPSTNFAAELDALVASGFQPTPRSSRDPLAALATRLRGLSPRRLLFAAGGTALAMIAIATVVVASLRLGLLAGSDQPSGWNNAREDQVLQRNACPPRRRRRTQRLDRPGIERPERNCRIGTQAPLSSRSAATFATATSSARPRSACWPSRPTLPTTPQRSSAPSTTHAASSFTPQPRRVTTRGPTSTC